MNSFFQTSLLRSAFGHSRRYHFFKPFQMVKKGFRVPTASTGNSKAQMNQIIKAYLQGLVTAKLLVSYPFIQKKIYIHFYNKPF